MAVTRQAWPSVSSMSLHVLAGNAAGRALYSKAGFEDHGNAQGLFGRVSGKKQSLLMVAPL